MLRDVVDAADARRAGALLSTDIQQMRGDGPWEIALRAGVRRGHIPDALRTLLFWRDDWHRTSEWHSWTLER